MLANLLFVVIGALALGSYFNSARVTIAAYFLTTGILLAIRDVERCLEKDRNRL